MDPFLPNEGAPGRGPLLAPGSVLAIEPMLTLGTAQDRGARRRVDRRHRRRVARRTLGAHRCGHRRRARASSPRVARRSQIEWPRFAAGRTYATEPIDPNSYQRREVGRWTIRESRADAGALRRARRRAVALCVRLTGDRARAEDVVQETLLRAWQHPEVTDDTERSARAWLFTVARNMIIDERRSARFRNETGSPDVERGARAAPGRTR